MTDLDKSEMMKRIEEKVRALPEGALDGKMVAECWDKTWQKYIRAIEERGDEDARRPPPPWFMHTKCVI